MQGEQKGRASRITGKDKEKRRVGGKRAGKAMAEKRG